MTLEEVILLFREKPYYIKQGKYQTAKRLKITPEMVDQAKEAIRGVSLSPSTSVKGPRILILDIETTPMQAYVWKRWKENVSLDQTIAEWFMICWSAKWLGEDEAFGDCCNDHFL